MKNYVSFICLLLNSVKKVISLAYSLKPTNKKFNIMKMQKIYLFLYNRIEEQAFFIYIMTNIDMSIIKNIDGLYDQYAYYCY